MAIRRMFWMCWNGGKWTKTHLFSELSNRALCGKYINREPKEDRSGNPRLVCKRCAAKAPRSEGL